MTDKADLARDYGVTEEQLQLKCSEDAILEIGEFISWREVGQRLPGVGRDGVRDGNKEGYNEAEKRTKVMEKWEERRGKSATYDEMITAMLKARKRKEAEKVFELLKREHGCKLPSYLGLARKFYTILLSLYILSSQLLSNPLQCQQ